MQEPRMAILRQLAVETHDGRPAPARLAAIATAPVRRYVGPGMAIHRERRP